MRKAQMEAFGLAVIVILVSLGILFILQFTVLSPKQEVRKPFVEQQLASNLLGAVLITSVTADCPQERDFTDLLTAYAKCDNTYCTQDDINNYEYINQTLTTVLNKTLSPSNKKYEFKTCVFDPLDYKCLGKPPCLVVEQDFQDCLALGKDITPARFFLPLGAGLPTATVDLRICS